MSLHNASNNPNYVNIVKSFSPYSTLKDLKFFEADPNDPSDLIEKLFTPHNNNSFTTPIPLISNPNRRSGKNLDFTGCVQPIIFEFDHCDLEFQEKRIEFLKDELKTPMFKVFSGNKSFHHYIFFKHFAHSISDYKNSCKKLLMYLCEHYPNYFQLKGSDKKDLIPDHSLFYGVQYCRQANGKREDGSFQKGEYFNKIEDGADVMDLDSLIKTIELDEFSFEGKYNDAITVVRDPRKSTLNFIAMGVEEGNRDVECFKAACDLKDCGFDRERLFEKLMDGAGKCDPPFSEFDVRQKIQSAWSRESDPRYTQITQPYAFIESSTGTYYYFNRETLYPASKDILKETFKSLGKKLPDPFPVYGFVFDVHSNIKFDQVNWTLNHFTPSEFHLMLRNNESINPLNGFPVICKLLSNVIPVQIERDYFLNWLAAILQTRNKMMTSFVFVGEQGSGKGVTLEHIIRPLFGNFQVSQVEDEELKSSFNGWIINKCFIAFNEVAHDNKGRNSLNSKIKSIITDPVITINDKHLRTYSIKNSINTVFFSNEHIPVLVERNDRRFNIIKTGGNLRKLNWFKPKPVFNKIKSELSSFAQYLWNLKVDLDMANEVMENDAKTALIEIGQNMYEEFTTHLRSNDVSWFVENMDTNSYNLLNDEEITKIQPKHIPKDVAVKLFNSLHPGKNITTNQLTKYLKLYGVYPDRDDDINRTRIYKW